MRDTNKTKAQLIDELQALRKHVAELEATRKRQQEGEHTAGKEATFNVINALADPLMLLDMEGTILFINEAFEKMSGHERAELMGRPFIEFLDSSLKKGELPKILQATESAFSGEETPPLEFTFVTKQGEEVPLAANASFVNDAKENRWGVVVTFRDMAEMKRAERILSESEQRFRALFEGALDGTFLVDPESGRILDANPAISQLLRRPIHEAVGKHYSHLLPDRLKEPARRYFEDLARDKGNAVPVETRLLDSDGREVSVEVLAQLIQVDGVPLVLATFRDLTERKRAEEALRRSEERYRLLVQNSSDMIVLLEADGRVRYTSPSLETLLGYTQEEIIGRNAFDYIHPDDTEDTLAKFEVCLGAPGQAIAVQYRFRHKDGSWRLHESVGNNQLDHPALGAIIVNCRDITERRETEERLRRSQGRYRMLYENLRDGSVTLDPDGRIMEFNSAFREMLGFDAQELHGLTYEQLTPEKWHRLEKKVLDQQVAKRGYSDIYEKECICKDGRVLPVELRTHLLREEDGTVVGRWVIVRDVSERKRIEEELLKAQKLESLGVLCGGIAHDFNNILTAVLANISMAQMYGDLEDDIAKMLADAEKASLRGKGLTQQLLTFAKGGEPIKKVLSLPGLLEETIDFTLSGSNVRCIFDLAEGLWPVEADEGQIGQVIQNVVLNADQAMPEGGFIRVRTENLTITEDDALPLAPGPHVKISITDQGLGIPEEHLKKIFDPFFTTKQKGRGLGLSTSFSILRRHEGALRVESTLGDGTRVDIYLPALPEGDAGAKARRQAPCKGEGRILLIDDDETLRKSIGMALGRLGYQVSCAEDGTEGIEAYREAYQSGRPIDAVVMDLTIPGGMGGREAARELLRIDPDAKLIVSSGYSTDPVMSDFASHGFRAVISKPYRIEALADTLHRVLNGK